MGNRLCICLILFVFGIFSFCRFSNAECDLGVWGESCQYNCSSNCYHGSDCFTNGNACGCEQDHGVCYGCTKKYHGDFCSLECNKNCSLSDECLQNGIGCGCHRQYGSCSSCPKTLWGQYCERGCSESCINSECDTGSGECTLGCIQGYYGDRCDLACPVSCQYGCVRDTAQCLPSYCVNCFGGLSNCDQGIGKCKSGCVEGFYGDSCDKTCAAITSISLCSKCTTLPSIGITVCSECQSGYYSDQFLNECKLCSTGCNSSSTSIAKCFPDSGICRFGCSSGWTGDKCDVFNCAVSHCDTCVVNQPTNCAVCQTEWFLDSGQCFQCSENCATTNVCDKTTGTCTAGCKSGWHGSRCMDSCTTNCLQGQCDTNGVCSNGCNGKRYGQKCDILCPNCLTTCNQNSGLCDSTCVNGFFGNDCSQSCPANCLNNLCNQGNGICLGCKSGYYGNTCQLPCNNNCGSNTCDATTGACSGSCIDGKYGDYCDLECPVNCSPKLCVKEGGACSSLCENGFYGSHCNVPCPTSCSSNKCNKEGGICTDNCPSGKYGDRCELSCSSNCNSTLCDRNTGRCLDGCKAGYYGDTCQNICARCDSMGCLQTTGSCIGTTKEEEDDETNIAIIIGAIIGGAVVLLIIIIIVCCHCVRTRNSRKGGSEDILTHKSDSLNGVDNPQFDHFDEIKKDDWVMRHHIPYEIVKQNGALNTQREAEAEIDYYDFHTRPLEVHVVHHDRQAVQADVMQPHPLAAQFDDFDGRDGIQVEMLPQYVEYMLHKANGFETEYNDLPQGLKHPHEVALRPGNKAKNRYKNIYTYDHSRVVLEPEDTVSDDSSSSTINDNSDYINASYLDGYHDQRAYIACQGPTDEMVNDFWRMVWQLRIQNIVMLTNLVELGHVKCKKYWPDEYKTEKYGNLYVKFDYQEVFADFILTNLIITRDNARLQVKHLQFTSWPDRDVPRYVTPLLEYYSKVKSLHREGPLLVHCSAGVGRSGTFIALDYLMDQADSEDKVNIYKCVDKMRISRPNMVQTSEQYTFLHIALVEALQTSQSPVDEDEFENYYNQMLIKDTRSGVSKLENEFRDVKCQKVQCMYEAASLGENKHRNRRPDILASDECRVFLWSKIKGCTDYINAIYLPSYRNKYCFIATEMPQCSTIIDFCRMIFQEEVRTVVMLDNSSSGINATEHYWPNPNQTVECGPFSIKVTETVEHQDYTLKSLKFSFSVDDQNGTYKVNQFHYKHWSEGKVTPYSVESFLNFVKAVTDWQSDSVRHPIIVHCLDGASKVGLFCLVRACLDRLQSDGEVSVVHALHHMRARRTQIVPNFDQYKFCHECILRQINSL